jgi:hypothetical protein
LTRGCCVPGRPRGSISPDLITDLPPSKRTGDFAETQGGGPARIRGEHGEVVARMELNDSRYLILLI